MKRNILTLCFAAIICVSMSAHGFAVGEIEEKTEDYNLANSEESQTTDVSQTFDMFEESFEGIDTYSTFNGSKGYCTLNYLSEGRYVRWSIHPDTTKSFVFSGEITIRTAPKTGKGTVKKHIQLLK